MTAMEKAKLKLVNKSGQPSIDVMFNPTDYSITRNMNYAELAVPGLAMPLLQFIRGETQTLELVLFVDSSDRKTPSPADLLAAGIGTDITQNTGAGLAPVPLDSWTALGHSPNCEQRLMALRLLVQIDSELHAPPVVEFSWGGSPRFRGVVTGFKEQFQMFDGEGHIVRARVTLTFKSYIPAEEQFRDINPQSPDRTKTHVVRTGERLDMIAAREYGDPAQWTLLASHNGLARPRVLVPGLLLEIPPLA